MTVVTDPRLPHGRAGSWPLPAPATISWMDRAACRGHDPDWWHPPVDKWAARRLYDRARKVCIACPVRLDCLAYAITTEPSTRQLRQGMWGGLIPAERHRHVEWLDGWDRCRHCDKRFRGRWGAWCSDGCRDAGRSVLHERRLGVVA